MKIITTQVFTLSELPSAAAKERARGWFRKGETEIWDGDMVIEDAKECFAHAGFDIDCVHFRGFSSQGDGACFEGSWRAAEVNTAAMRKRAPNDTALHRIADECARIAALFPSASLSVKHSGHYCHEHCTDFTVSIEDANGDAIETEEAEQAEQDLIAVSKAAMRWIYAALEEDYNWRFADEQVDESLEANGYTFTVEGERFG